LRDPRTYYVVNLLIFLRRAATQSVIPHVKPLLRHGSQAVKIEALSTLLKFKDPEAVKLLREALRSEDPDVAFKGVSLAGLYRVAEVTEDVLARIKRVILFEADYGVNAEVIKALGEIGDHRAIADLEKLARANWSLYPQRLLEMKEVLFESLGRYPKASIQGLVRIGDRANSEKIRKACRKLMERA
jgi:HEAT repeat protein